MLLKVAQCGSKWLKVCQGGLKWVKLALGGSINLTAHYISCNRPLEVDNISMLAQMAQDLDFR